MSDPFNGLPPHDTGLPSGASESEISTSSIYRDRESSSFRTYGDGDEPPSFEEIEVDLEKRAMEVPDNFEQR